ncbi:MAG: NAD(P)/FAD-dependent oxidoreductase [Emcibacter sp.]|nr:NAD(P)/FAD-dependent oxidoreductase [Emcibacter sp.]
MTDFDAVIIGAGAAGLMCAIEGGKRGRRILVIEKNEAVAGKIRISGGGRCNFTNLRTGPENFLSDNPRFCLSALRRYLPQNFIRLVEKHDIAYREKKLGQLFCDGKSHQIIDMLLKECDQAGVIIRTETTVEDIQKTDTGFRLLTADETVTCRSLVIASGGKSIPKMGASGFGYEVATHFGHSLIDPAPALVPLTFQNDLLGQFKSLAGVSVEATVRRGKKSFTEALLFTHRGLSGPAILQISSYMEPGDDITIDLSPHRDMLDFLKEQRTVQPKQELHTVLTQRFARRLALFICQEAGVDGRLADLSNQKFEQIARFIHGWTLKPGGTEGFRTAEVTRGGVNTREISSKTFESNLTPGLYFIGEVLDVTGHLGGYNFQWAWASGHGAGQYI